MSKKQKKRPGGPQDPSAAHSAPDYSEAKQLESMIRKAFSASKENLRRIGAEYPNMTAMMDLDANRTRRRVKAATVYAAKVRELVQDVCPDIPEVFSIEEEWAHINSLPLTTYDIQEEGLYLVLGAAIWMLDHIKQNGHIQEAIKILPKDDGTRGDVYLPNIYDAVHQDEVITAMVCAIELRNSDCERPGQKRGNRSGESEERCFADDFTATETHRQDVPSRRRFEALLQMIRPEDIQAAVSQFETAMFDWIKCYYRCRAEYCEKEKEFFARRNKFMDSVQEGLHLSQSAFSPVKKAPLNILNPGISSAAKAGFEKLLTDPLQIMNRIERFEEESRELFEEVHKLAFSGRKLAAYTYAQIERDYSSGIADAISGFSISDPYAICFALLYLLDTGSDLPWLYFPGTAVMECAGVMLPWFALKYDEFEDAHWSQYYDADDYFPPRLPKNPPAFADWYRLDYVDNTEAPELQVRTNLAQIVYEATGGIIPRDLHRYDDALTHLRHYGITGKKMQIPLLYCMTLLGEGMFRSEDRRLQFDLSEEEESRAVDSDAEQSVGDTEGADQLAKQNDALKQENERLKRAAYAAERENRELRKQHDALIQRTQREHQELAELREILFHRENDLEAELDEDASSIVMPYTVRRTTVVFGGHDTWSKVIRPLLAGDIRFIDRDMRPDADLIRHAGAVWVQTNCLSHASYYKIINIIRTHRIPLHYFKYVSAEKCAAQLALEDQKASV